jgi:hypothetical protein
MSARTVIKALLEADATLLAIATGGVYDYDEVGRLGLGRDVAPTAYGTNGIIKPCVVVKGRGPRPTGAVQDDVLQVSSTSEVVEIWLYQDEGYTTIKTMEDRIYTLLHGKQVSGAFVCRWAGTALADQRDDTLGNVSVEREDYQVIALR